MDEPRLLVVGTQQLGLGCETGWGKPGGVSQIGCLQVWRPLCNLGGVARQNPSHALFDNSRHQAGGVDTGHLTFMPSHHRRHTTDDTLQVHVKSRQSGLWILIDESPSEERNISTKRNLQSLALFQ